MGFPIVISHFSPPPKPKRVGTPFTQPIEMPDYWVFFDLRENFAKKDRTKSTDCARIFGKNCLESGGKWRE